MLGSYLVALVAMLVSALTARTLIRTIRHFDPSSGDANRGH
jgi:hypothetical protein